MSKVKEKDPRCKNCGNPKSHHSYHDVFCLKVMKWNPSEFEKFPQIKSPPKDEDG